MAPPRPWTARVATSIGKVCAAPQATEPRVNIARAATKIRRAPKRSANQPLTGMKIASARTYVVTARFICTGVA